MKNLLKLTKDADNKPILIGIQNIISVDRFYDPNEDTYSTRIKSRGAMIETFYVKETVEEIYEMLFI